MLYPYQVGISASTSSGNILPSVQISRSARVHEKNCRSFPGPWMNSTGSGSKYKRGTPGGLQSPTSELPCAGGTARTRPICSPLSGAPNGRPYEGLFALNIFRPSGVISGTTGLIPRSPPRCQTPVRSCASNCPETALALDVVVCARPIEEKEAIARSATTKLLSRFRILNLLYLTPSPAVGSSR